MKKLLQKWYVKLTFYIFGLGLIIWGIFFQIKIEKKIDKDLITEATVIEVTEETSPYSKMEQRILVKFTVDDKEYEGYLRKYEEEAKIDDKVTIYYNKEDPNFFYKYEINPLGYSIIAGGIFLILIPLSNFIKITYVNKKIKKIDKKIEKLTNENK